MLKSVRNAADVAERHLNTKDFAGFELVPQVKDVACGNRVNALMSKSCEGLRDGWTKIVSTCPDCCSRMANFKSEAGTGVYGLRRTQSCIAAARCQTQMRTATNMQPFPAANYFFHDFFVEVNLIPLACQIPINSPIFYLLGWHIQANSASKKRVL